MKKEIKIQSTDGKNKLHVILWEPEGDIKAVVQISHGMLEHIDRYEEFAQYLNAHNILVVGNDHLGHGHTAKSGDMGYFGNGKSKTVVDDLNSVTRYVKKHFGYDVPYFLLGHSMGSFMIGRYIMTYGKEVSGAIFCGTGYTPHFKLEFIHAILSIIKIFKGERYRSSFLKNTIFGGYNKKIDSPKSENDWLTRDEETISDYDNDKYNAFLFTINGYETLFDVIKFFQNKDNIDKIPKNLPVYLASGKEDPVGNYGKGVTKVYNMYKKSGIKDVHMKLYEDDRHEIINELDKDIVHKDILTWIEQHI